MRDPHVVSLRYRLRVDPVNIFGEPPPVEHETADYRISLAGGELRFEMKQHYSSSDQAKKAVSGFVRAWEIDSALRGDPITFQFEDAQVIDRDPSPPGAFIAIGVGGFAGLECSGTAVMIRNRYPEPPSDFQASPDVETLWNRFQQYQNGREPLPAMAYFCYTVLTKKPKRHSRSRASGRNRRGCFVYTRMFSVS